MDTDNAKCDRDLHNLTDLELAQRIFDLKAKVDTHMLELARRLRTPEQPKE